MSVVSTRDLLRFLPEISVTEATARFEGVSDFSTREGEIALFQYAKKQFIGEEFEKLRAFSEADLRDLQEVNGMLSEATRGRFLYGLLAGSFQAQTSMGTESRSVALLNLMVEGEHWEELERAQELSVISDGYGLSQGRRAEWAMSLPERKETFEVFEDSVGRYLADMEEEARDWIEALPPGGWRDRGMLAYARQVLDRGNSLEKSRGIIEQIEDPEIRRAGEEHQLVYEKARGIERGR